MTSDIIDQALFPSFIESCYRTPGERLAYLRRRAGYSFHDVATQTGISKSELSRLENDLRQLSSTHASSLATLYGIDRKTFLSIVDYDPSTRLTKMAMVNPGNSEIPIVSLLRCFSLHSLIDKKTMAQAESTIQLKAPLQIGAAGYALRLDIATESDLLPLGSVVVADPDARVVLGDLVVNMLDWQPVLIALRRDEQGYLIGLSSTPTIAFPPETSLKQFHKIIGLFPAPHLLELDT